MENNTQYDGSSLNPRKLAREFVKKHLGKDATITKIAISETDISIEIYSPNRLQWDQSLFDAAAFQVGTAVDRGLKIRIVNKYPAPDDKNGHQ